MRVCRSQTQLLPPLRPFHTKMQPSYSKSSKTSPSGINVGTWLPAEDARLKEAVAKYGPRWVLIASEVATRTGDQCAKRWNENLNPELDHGPWNAVEDKLLLHLVEVYGHDWKFMANNFFEKRAPLALKNRNSLLKRRQKRQSQTSAPEQQKTQPPSATGSPVPSVAFPPLYRSHPDLMSGSFYADGPISGTSSPYSRPASVMDGDMPMYHSNMGSTSDLGEMFGATAGSPLLQSLPSLPQSFASVRTSEPTSAPDSVAWQSFIDCNTVYPTPDTINGMEFDSQGLVTNALPDNGSDKSVEYSVTCPRGNLQNLVSHLVDAAMTGNTAPGFADENQVMLTLRLQGI